MRRFETGGKIVSKLGFLLQAMQAIWGEQGANSPPAMPEELCDDLLASLIGQTRFVLAGDCEGGRVLRCGHG